LLWLFSINLTALYSPQCEEQSDCNIFHLYLFYKSCIPLNMLAIGDYSLDTGSVWLDIAFIFG
jgi:hypothetical protein